jgi:hypothetical protein
MFSSALMLSKKSRSRLRCVSFFLSCCLVSVTVVRSAFAQALPASDEASDVGAKIRSFAAQAGAPGSPEYSAALRSALASAAVSLRDAKDDPSRTIVVSTPPQGTQTQVTAVDRDSRYTGWLDKMADQPLASLHLQGCQATDVRVIGGETVLEPQCFPEISLMSSSGADDFCSGVLINDQRTIVTAAHCLCSGAIEYAVFGKDMQDVKSYRVGVASQKGHDGIVCEGNGTSRDAFLASLAGQDIAIVKLAKDVPTDIARFTPLPPAGEASRLFATGNKSLLVLGFGFTERSRGKPTALQDPKKKTMALTSILSPDCSGSAAGGKDSEAYGCQAGQEILAVDTKPVGPCYGDSGGGGYMITDKPGSSESVAILVGITSRLAQSNCGSGAIYTSFTPEILSWVKSAIATDR